MARQVLTSAEITALVNQGKIVVYKGRIIKRLSEVPSDEQILDDFPFYAYTRIVGDAQAIKGYEIVGLPDDGQTVVWNDTEQRWEFGDSAGGGGGAWGTITGTLASQTDLQSALDLKANLASPTLTGVPAAPTASLGTNTTQIASTAFVRGEVSALVNSAPSTLDTLNELATALGNDPNFATTVTNSLASKANLTDNLSVFAATSSLQLKTLMSDETGSENLVFRLAPTLKNIVVNQNQNNDENISGIRATDSSPTGSFINFKNAAANTSLFKVNTAGNTYSGAVFLNSSGSLQWGDNGDFGTIRGFLGTTADGIFRFGDSAGGGSPQIILGSAGASTGIRLKRSSTTLAIRNGDDTADASITGLNLNLTGAQVITNNSGTIFAAGRQGLTNSAFSVISSGGTDVTGLSVTSAEAGSGVTFAATSSGANENLLLTPKGTGTFQVRQGSAGNAFQILRASDGAQTALITDNGNLTLALDLNYHSRVFFTAAGGDGSFEVSGAATNAHIKLGPTPDVGITKQASGLLRVTSGSTGAGKLILGTSTDTANAQLSVYTQSTTEAALKLKAASGTSGTQEVLGVYDGTGTFTSGFLANGTLAFGGNTTSHVGLVNVFNIGLGVKDATGANWKPLYAGGAEFWNGPGRQTVINSASVTGVSVRSGDYYAFASSSTDASTSLDLFLYRDAANTLAQRNATNAQTFRLYETFTDASNYSALRIQATNSYHSIIPIAAGTGTLRGFYIGNGASSTSRNAIDLNPNGTIDFVSNGSSGFRASSGNLIFPIDNAYDIGASGATRPRNVYVGTAVINSGYIQNALGASVGTAAYYGWGTGNGGSSSIIGAPSNGVITIQNNTATDFDRLQFGGTTSSFPALKRSTNTLQVRLADDSDDAPLTTFTVKTKALTVAALPSASTAGAGTRAFVTDASTTLILGLGTTVIGGGANSVPVYSDGSSWLVG